MAYDPQRNRVRAQPVPDEPAPVDLVLGGLVDPERVEPEAAATALPDATVLPEPAAPLELAVNHESTASHEHGPDCDHDHDHGPDLRLIVAAGVASVVAAAFLLRRRRTARR